LAIGVRTTGGTTGVITTLIVDDDSDVRALVRMVVEVADNGLTVSGEAADGPEALASWRDQRPVAVILDYSMPGMSGLDVARQMLDEVPDQKIVLFTAYLDDDMMAAARDIGVVRCMRKTDVMDLPATLRELAPSS
jgi:CheY-like chemotaxis protein